MQASDISSNIQIIWCGEADIKWLNEEYEKINFQLSNLKTDRIAIATYNGEYVGFGRLCHIGNSDFELGGMHVYPGYRKLGIARKIVQFLLENKALGATIYCLPFEHLKDFYKSEGFGEVSEESFHQIPRKILEKFHWCNKTYPHKVLLLSNIAD